MSGLKKQLLELPLSNQDKVYLWLVMTGEKSAAAISVKACWYCDDDQTVKPREKDVKKLKSFLEENGIHYRIKKSNQPGEHLKRVKGQKRTKVAVTVFGEIYFVSLKERFAEKLYQCFTDPDGLGVRNNLMIGKLLGYPEAAVEEFALATNWPGQTTPESLSPIKETYEILGGNYWEAYLGYVVRKGHEIKDSATAKRWADVIRQDLPELADRYEKEMKRIIKKIIIKGD